MGRIVFAAAMSHVLDPDYYGTHCGPTGRRTVEALMDEVRAMGRAFAACRPDALIVVADDHLNVFSFNAVPALAVRIGRHVDRMEQDEAVAFDRALDGLPARYALHEELANRILEDGLEAGFDLTMSTEASLDHAFLSPVMTMHPEGPPPLVPIWVNCFVAPQPTPRRCFAFGRHIAQVVERGPWNVGIIATGGMSHFPELSFARVGQSDVAFDRKVLEWLAAGDHEALCQLTVKELHQTGEHELLNWMVAAGAVSPARATPRFFGELGRINLAAVEWVAR
jgi:aromatic ring-opening dioxygenase catalytic subunit (LigB family)